MPWRDWSDYKRAQVVNAATVPLFVVFAVSMWVQGNLLWAAIFAAAALVNTAGGLWRARQARRRSQGDPGPGQSGADDPLQ